MIDLEMVFESLEQIIRTVYLEFLFCYQGMIWAGKSSLKLTVAK